MGWENFQFPITNSRRAKKKNYEINVLARGFGLKYNNGLMAVNIGDEARIKGNLRLLSFRQLRYIKENITSVFKKTKNCKM